MFNKLKIYAHESKESYKFIIKYLKKSIFISWYNSDSDKLINDKKKIKWYRFRLKSEFELEPELNVK